MTDYRSDAPSNIPLVKRVHSCIVCEPECGHMQARSVIREMAEWLRERGGWNQVTVAAILEQELEKNDEIAP